MKTIDNSKNGWIAISIHVIPRSSSSDIISWTAEGSLKAKISSPPVDDSANKELIRLLSKHLDIKKADIRISSGRHSKNKRVEIPCECKNRLLSFEDI